MRPTFNATYTKERYLSALEEAREDDLRTFEEFSLDSLFTERDRLRGYIYLATGFLKAENVGRLEAISWLIGKMS